MSSINNAFRALKSTVAAPKNAVMGTTNFRDIANEIKDANTPGDLNNALNKFLKMKPSSFGSLSARYDIAKSMDQIFTKLKEKMNSEVTNQGNYDLNSKVISHMTECCEVAANDTNLNFLFQIVDSGFHSLGSLISSKSNDFKPDSSDVDSSKSNDFKPNSSDVEWYTNTMHNELYDKKKQNIVNFNRYEKNRNSGN